METDLLIDMSTGTGRQVRYHTVGSASQTETHSNTDDEMLDVTNDVPFNYNNLVDKSHGELYRHHVVSILKEYTHLMNILSMKALVTY